MNTVEYEGIKTDESGQDMQGKQDSSTISNPKKDNHISTVINEEYEQDLLERLSDIKRRMENKRVSNHIVLPFAIMTMIFVFLLYPNRLVIAILSMFMVPSILFNIVFILLPIYGKVYIVQKVSFYIYKMIMFVIVLLYILNLILVFGNMTSIKLNEISTGSLYICHFVVQMTWMWLHFQQMLTLYYWIQYMKHYNCYLLEATFIQSNFDHN